MHLKNVIVTGGVNGIGRSTVYKFVKEGYRTCFFDIDEAGKEMAEGINFELGDERARFYQADVSDLTSVQAACSKALDWMGGRVDVLVNNAGIVAKQDGEHVAVEDIRPETLQRQFSVNVFSVMYMCREIVPAMRRQGFGTIINIASLAAFGTRLNAHYAASKGAVEALTRSLAMELAPDITVLAISPGLTRTEFIADLSPEQTHGFVRETQTGKLIEPWEVARQVVHFSHADCAALTGQIIHVNGGSNRQFR
ncbi:SDR family oxidoreductase [Janthinobacterium sp. 17J80-10]|uniref:SDR family NAD(P)-dependent oxidoreductase n=1 Tax=Janthinobacterium sp. 17J80-10 TaxID=2497863 RepID=UPI001005427C|nr:SDR family oxidoreductase [Janthinobacterium sp. 17J80-10]QAU33240.1 SDR family oxidoreductase [Janthinobacterium sp. 17J80-10]